MMDAQSIRRAVIDSVMEIAPEADFAKVDPGRSLREQLDLDSFDFLNLLIALQGRVGVDVPEADYRLVDSLDGLVDYLDRHQVHG